MKSLNDNNSADGYNIRTHSVPSEFRFYIVFVILTSFLLMYNLSLWCYNTKCLTDTEQIAEINFVISHSAVDGNKLNIDLALFQETLFQETLFKDEQVEKPRHITITSYDALGVSRAEFNYLKWLVFTEANLECDKGQQLVVHTVMGRVEHNAFPDTVKKVVEQPSQFCGRWVANWGMYTERNAENVAVALMNRASGEIGELEQSVLYFHDHRVIDSGSYARRFGLEVLGRVGNHTFLGV